MPDPTKKELQTELQKYKDKAAQEERRRLVLTFQSLQSQLNQVIQELQDKYPDALPPQLQSNGQ